MNCIFFYFSNIFLNFDEFYFWASEVCARIFPLTLKFPIRGVVLAHLRETHVVSPTVMLPTPVSPNEGTAPASNLRQGFSILGQSPEAGILVDCQSENESTKIASFCSQKEIGDFFLPDIFWNHKCRAMPCS